MVSDTKEGKKNRNDENARLVCIVEESWYVGEPQYVTSSHNFAIEIISC